MSTLNNNEASTAATTLTAAPAATTAAAITTVEKGTAIPPIEERAATLPIEKGAATPTPEEVATHTTGAEKKRSWKEAESQAWKEAAQPVMRITQAETSGPAARAQAILVAAHCRVSTDLEEQEGSLESQAEHWRQYAAAHSEWSLVGLYDGILPRLL